MDNMCEVCGNEGFLSSSTCRFCGARKTEKEPDSPKAFVHRVVNIELGRPLVAEALNKLIREIENAHRVHIAVLTIIHGYGSSGRGGAIRRECRKSLEYLKSRGKIRSFIPGENFSKREGSTKALLRRFPSLMSNDNLNRANRGVTLVIVR